jgi:hypothetical protein
VDAFNPGSIDEIIMRRYFQGMLMVWLEIEIEISAWKSASNFI